ncbi:glycosyltransferase family 4 protein [Clostridium thermarum]|uniref:glycosyltransferase family 4 protein n=1 Tax=Clostridium thermarum TaxID=1716543 RepID=UPI001120BA5A|nr:glycosyltransferase family 4 protein [Clostridium thermarum]
MKKVLYVTTVSRTINAFLIPHINHLIDMGYQVDCACSIDKPINSGLFNSDVRIFEVSYQRVPFSSKNFRALRQIEELYKNEKYDVIHVHTPVAAFFTRLLKRRFPEAKIIYTCHGFHFYKGASIDKWIMYYNAEKLMAKYTDRIIVINEEDFKNAKKLGFQEENIFKINGVGIEEITKVQIVSDIREEVGISKKDFVITVVAEVNKNKNQIQLLKAMRKLVHRHADIKVLLVGEGNMQRAIKKKIDKYKLNHNVFMVGHRTDVYSIMSQSDVIGLFSKREGLPRCLMEAMSLGKPLLVTDNRGSRELVIPNMNGLIVKVGDIKETCRAISKLYEDEKSRISMGSCSKSIIKRFTLDSILKQLEDVYSTI